MPAFILAADGALCEAKRKGEGCALGHAASERVNGFVRASYRQHGVGATDENKTKDGKAYG